MIVNFTRIEWSGPYYCNRTEWNRAGAELDNGKNGQIK